MMKTGQIKRCQEFNKLGRHELAMRNPPIIFFDRLRVKKNDSVTSERELAMSKILTFYCWFRNYL